MHTYPFSSERIHHQDRSALRGLDRNVETDSYVGQAFRTPVLLVVPLRYIAPHLLCRCYEFWPYTLAARIREKQKNM